MTRADDNTLTMDKLERIIRVRKRYLAGLPVPRSDLDVLKARAEDVIGLYLDPNRPPQISEDRCYFGPVISLDITAC